MTPITTAAPATVKLPALSGGRTQAEIKVRSTLLGGNLRGWPLAFDGIPDGLSDELDRLREEHHAILNTMQESVERRSPDWQALVRALNALVERVVAVIQAGDHRARVDGRQVIANRLAMAQKARREQLLDQAEDATRVEARQLVEEADRCVAVARWLNEVSADLEPFRRNLVRPFSSRGAAPGVMDGIVRRAFTRPWFDARASQAEIAGAAESRVADLAEQRARAAGVLPLDQNTTTTPRSAA